MCALLCVGPSPCFLGAGYGGSVLQTHQAAAKLQCPYEVLPTPTFPCCVCVCVYAIFPYVWCMWCMFPVCPYEGLPTPTFPCVCQREELYAALCSDSLAPVCVCMLDPPGSVWCGGNVLR